MWKTKEIEKKSLNITFFIGIICILLHWWKKVTLVAPKKMLKLNRRPVYCSQLYGIQDYSNTNVCFLDRCSKWKRKFQVWCTTTKYSILWDWNSSRKSIFRRSLQGVCNSNRYYVKKSLNFICSTYFSNPSKEDFVCSLKSKNQ